VYENIKGLRPYFFSLREIDNNVSLDIKFPLTWKYENIISQYKLVKAKVQDKNDKFHLVSLISTATQEGYDVVFACAGEAVVVNKEEEEKQRLFHAKVKELQALFQNQSLDKLKEISFIDTYGQEDSTGIRMVGERADEGFEGDTGAQEEDD
jgi:hypothetical protein